MTSKVRNFFVKGFKNSFQSNRPATGDVEMREEQIGMGSSFSLFDHPDYHHNWLFAIISTKAVFNATNQVDIKAPCLCLSNFSRCSLTGQGSKVPKG